LKTVSAAVAVCLAFSLVAGVYGAVVWEQQISWAWSQAIESFEVDGKTLVDYGELVSNGSVVRCEFYNVSNTGNVEVTVKPDVVFIGGVEGCWDKVSAVVPVGGAVGFNLTLSISGAGSCTVRFVKV
jgi:hypothetical protein